MTTGPHPELTLGAGLDGTIMAGTAASQLPGGTVEGATPPASMGETSSQDDPPPGSSG